jgi:hypothetical protein
MKLITKIIVLFLGFLPLVLAAPAGADTNDKIFAACPKTGQTSTICKDKDTKTNPVLHVIKTAANLIALATGAIAVVIVILSGITMITSSGNPEAIANARKQIIYALVGLVVIALAWTALSFVVGRLIK